MGSGKQAKAERQKERAALAEMVFWHGGVAGLQVGETIIPLQETKSRVLALHLPEGYGEHPGRADRVYVTSERDLARAYARIRFPDDATPGAVYRVKPTPPLEMDADYAHVPGKLSMQCQGAVILGVEEVPVMSLDEAHAASGKYSTWDDGTPMYDENGAVNPDGEMRRFNLTTADTRRMWKPGPRAA